MTGLRTLLLVPLLVLGAAASVGVATLDQGRAAGLATASVTPLSLDGVTVRATADTAQVVTVNHTNGYYARVTLWRRRHGRWEMLAQTRGGRIGYGGLVAPQSRRQASGATPLGTFRLLSAFGTHPAATGWRLPYRMTGPGDYWVEDNGSAYYNRYRNKAQGGFRWWLPASDPNSSERLRSFPTQYEYSIVTGFNYVAQVRHRGAGIFFHVNGPGATAGCVSAPRWFLHRTMAVLDPARRPVIAIGR